MKNKEKTYRENMEEIVKKICLKEINKDEKSTGKIIVGQRNQNKKKIFFLYMV